MSKHLTDEQRQLVADNHNLIYGFLNKYNLPDDEWYDVVVFGLINAAKTYNATTKFSTYAYKCMYNEMRNEFRYRSTHIPEDLLSLDYEYNNEKGDTYTLADIWSNERDFTAEIIDKHNNNSLLQFFESRLRTDGQREQFKLMVAGVPAAEIAEQCCVSKQQVYLLRKNLLSEYKKIFRDDGSVRPAVVGGKIRIANNPYLFGVMARDDRYIVCNRKYNNGSDYYHVIIDLQRQVYGQDGGESGRYNTKKMCGDRLRELRNGTISIAADTEKKLDFYVA